jgi:hypothetical protein
MATVEPTDARNIAYARHDERRNAAGEPIVQHLERVAASVPAEAKTVAYLHDILEHSDASIADLEAEGVTPVELEAVELLTRDPDESFEAHTLRITYAKGRRAGSPGRSSWPTSTITCRGAAASLHTGPTVGRDAVWRPAAPVSTAGRASGLETWALTRAESRRPSDDSSRMRVAFWAA